MTPERLLEILAVAERLKCTPRHSWTSTGRRESVAEHSWRVALMALLVADEFPDLCIDRVVRMCLLHDLGEAFTGDIPAFEKHAADETHEAELLAGWISTLPEPLRGEWQALFAEMEALETPESKLYKALDKLDALTSSSPHSESMDNIRDMVSALRNTSHFRSHFLIPSKGDRLIPLDVADVLYFYIVDGAVYAVTLRHEKILIPHTLDEVAASIDPSVFFRVNRQYIISRSAVKDMAVWFTGRLVVNLTVETEEKIIVSRQKVSDFKDWFAGLY